MFQLLLKYLYVLPIFIKNNSDAKVVANIKYILMWENTEKDLFTTMGEGRDIFLNRSCPYNNCYVTSNRMYIKDFTKFHVVLFYRHHLNKWKANIPRTPAQKYVFVETESADNKPLCTHINNNFFNWTWTYKLDSDIQFPYMIIRDKDNNVIGPKPGIDWIPIQDMDDVNEDLKLKLKSKKKLVAWFVSNWFPRSRRIQYAEDLSKFLRDKGYRIDIYGKLGIYKCNNCLTMLEKDYYFYLSFENSLAEDYVTEKLLNPLQHYTVPIVYGGADYSRFLPNGSYLDITKLGPQKLASIMITAIKNPEEYYNFFKWRNHYSYYYPAESPHTDVFCNFCKIINNRTLMKKPTTVNNFKKWWNPKKRCPLYNFSTIIDYIHRIPKY